MTPATAVKPLQEDKVPPEGVKVTVTFAVVTTLPPESKTVNTGSIANGDCDAPATGWVVKTNVAAVPGLVTLNPLLVADVKPVADAVRKYVVPTWPAKLQLVKVTTPLTGVNPEQNVNLPFPDGVRMIGVVAEVTTLPSGSSSANTGSTKKSVPDTPATGCVVKTSLLAPPVILKGALVTDNPPLDAEAVIVMPSP
jgi:hypothetical protein